MSVFNIKSRCAELDISLTELFEEVKKSNPKFRNITLDMFSNMHRGRYNYGIGPEVMSAANEILCKKETARKGARKDAP